MFGLEILDVAIGLILVYLLLALFATALNEYVAAVLNLRGKELAHGLGRLLDDLDETDAVKNAVNGVSTKVTTTAASLTEQLYNHRLVRPFATRQGWMTRLWWWLLRRKGKPRLPSYIPARTFALALLDIVGVNDKDASLDKLVPGESDTSAQAVTAATERLTRAEAAADGDNDTEVAAARAALSSARLAHVLAILKQESSLDLTEHLRTLGRLPQTGRLAGALQVQVGDAVTGAQTQLQKLHDGVEVWFNNSMDRVSGAYKRKAQGSLFVLGLLIAAWMNADTIDMWHRLAKDDQLRAAMVRRAEATVAALDTTLADSAAAMPADTTPATTTRVDTAQVPATPPAPSTPATNVGANPASVRLASVNAAAGDSAKPDSAKLAAVKQARANYLASRTRLDSMELQLGWTIEEAERVGLLKKDSTETDSTPPAGIREPGAVPVSEPVVVQEPRGWVPKGYDADPFFEFKSRAGFLKLVGLLFTGLAISLGAPFWFDLLNKVISIRTAGRSPAEKPKSPEGGPKRIAERAPK